MHQAQRLTNQFEKREIETKVEMQIAKCHEPKENEGVDFNISSDNNSASENFNDDDVCSSPILHGTNEPLKQELSLKPKLELRRLDNVKEEEEIRTLTESEKETMKRIREIFYGEIKVDIPSLKGKDRISYMKEVKMVNKLLPNVELNPASVTSVNKLLYAGSYVVCEKLGLLKKKKGKRPGKPWWQRRLETSIQRWRKDLGRVSEIAKGTKLKERVIFDLNRKYNIAGRGTKTVNVFLENKILAASAKIKTFIDQEQTQRQNFLFSSNQAGLYKQLGKKVQNSNESPNAKETLEFWSKIWSERTGFNKDATWLRDFESHMSKKGNLKWQEDVVITLDDVKNGIKRMKNWKAPGLDGVRGFWFKHFPSIHGEILTSLEKCLSEGEVPSWMVQSKTQKAKRILIREQVLTTIAQLRVSHLCGSFLLGSLQQRFTNISSLTINFQTSKKDVGKDREERRISF